MYQSLVVVKVRLNIFSTFECHLQRPPRRIFFILHSAQVGVERRVLRLEVLHLGLELS